MNIAQSTAPAGTPVAATAGHRHHHHGGGKSSQAVTDAVSKALGMSADDLKKAQQSGTSLNDLAKAKGISADQLQATITQALQASNSSLSAARAQQIAARIAGGTGASPGAAAPNGAATGAADSDGDNDGSRGGGFSKLATANPSFASSSLLSTQA
jgi:hypothetical protein